MLGLILIIRRISTIHNLSSAVFNIDSTNIFNDGGARGMG